MNRRDRLRHGSHTWPPLLSLLSLIGCMSAGMWLLTALLNLIFHS